MKHLLMTMDFIKLPFPSGTYLLKAEYPKHQAWEKFRIEKYEISLVVKMNLDITLPVNEKFTKKYGSPITAEPKKENKSKRKNYNKQ